MSYQMTKEEKERDEKIREEIKELCRAREKQFPNAMKSIITKREMEERKNKNLDCTNYVTLKEAMMARYKKPEIQNQKKD